MATDQISSSPLPPQRIRVELADRAYDVTVGPGVLENLGPVVRGLLPDVARALIALDTGVPEGLRGRAVGSLAGVGINTRTELLHATEEHKSVHTFEKLLNAAMSCRLERQEPIISLGGGIVCDLAGFAAASYRRGVPFVQCPTTLLAMVDAAVGGKTGINLHVDDGSGGKSLRKNMAGSFWQPRAVLCDIDALSTLPGDEFASGLAECVKHATIGAQCADAELFDWMARSSAAITRRDPATLLELVARNIAIKARVVAADEREESSDLRGGRMALNAGHTIGHALEAWAASRGHALKHGQAVGLGLLAEMMCGEAAGVTTHGATEHVRKLIVQLGLPDRLDKPATTKEVSELMGDDKKVLGGRLRLSIPTGTGECRMLVAPTEDWLRTGLRAIGVH